VFHSSVACTARRLSPRLNRIALGLAALVMLTSSFDIWLVLQAGGNYRFCQLLVPFLCGLALLRSGPTSLVPTLAAKPLLVWLFFLVLFIPASEFWPKSLGYCLWLALNLLLMFAFVQLFSDGPVPVERLVRSYGYSFGAIAACGIVQFCLPLLGWGGPLVMQWWIPDRLARVNGFSYEPSYFATYLLVGSVMMRSLKYAGSQIFSSGSARVISWLITLGILLSSSRLGILFLVTDILLYRLRPWLLLLRDLVQARIRFLTLRALRPALLSMLAAGLLLAFGIQFARSNPLIVLMFLSGTGVSGTTAHSAVEREGAFADTLKVFQDNIVVGRSLGGVSPAIAELHGSSVQSFEDTKAFEGMSVFAEVLAASGIIGVIPFVWFLVITIRKPLQLAQRVTPVYRDLLRACVRSLVFALAILQFNQNILRPYVWVHLAVLATIYAAAVRSAAKPIDPFASCCERTAQT
jgi:hypothetical protein